MPAPTLQFKRGLFTNLPGLKAGEPGFTTDFFELYVGIDSTTNNNKFLGSHRYWTKGTTSTGSGVNFVEGTSNGSDFITLKAPDTLAGIVTFTLPSADGNPGQVLSTNGSGTLSFTTLAASSFTIRDGIGSTDSVGLGQTLTFAGTANEIETAVTDNQVQIGLPGAVSITTSVVVGSGVTINISGIVAATGIVTASSFVSNVLTGTAPISVASSTQVTNLNAQYIGGLGAPTSQVIGATDTQTLTNKTIALGSNTISGTLAEFNSALTDADFVSILGTETLSNKTLLAGTATPTGTASQPLQVDGGAYVSGTLGIGTTNPDQVFKLVVNGSANFIGSVTSSTGFFVNGSLIGGAISGTNLVGTALSVSGISTFSGGPVLIGGGASTGTVGQVLQVAGINSSVYIGGNLGVGVTNPTSKLSVDGGINVDGGDVTSNTASLNLFNANVTNANVLGAGTNIVIGATTGITTIRNAVDLDGDLNVDGGDVTSNTASLNLFNANVTNANVLGAGTNIVIGATSGIATINNPTVVGTQATQNLYNTVATTVNAFGAGTAVNLGANSGTLTVGNPTVVGTQTTQDLYNTVATTVNAFGDASTIGIGSTSATLTLRPSTVVGANATQNLYNTTATTVNAFGAGTAVNLGANSGTLTVGNPTVVGTQATQNLYNTVATNLNFAGAATALVIGANSGITTVRNDLTVVGDLQINGNDIKASDGATNITLSSSTLTTFAGDIKVAGNDIQASDGNANITLTSNTLTTFSGDIKVGGNDIQASDNTVAITLSGADVTVAGDLKVGGNDIKASDNTVAITLSGADVTVAGDLKVGGNDIKASDGTTAITLSTVTGNVGVSSNLTVSGNLFVNGTTTQINTDALKVEDRTIDLGIVNGDAPSSDTTWDLGILFNYRATTAKKSAVIWEHGDSRFKFASILDADTEGNSSSTPSLTVNTFAPIEIGQLWVNDCAGSSQVISCTGTTRNLENITIDCGSFV